VVNLYAAGARAESRDVRPAGLQNCVEHIRADAESSEDHCADRRDEECLAYPRGPGRAQKDGQSNNESQCPRHSHRKASRRGGDPEGKATWFREAVDRVEDVAGWVKSAPPQTGGQHEKQPPVLEQDADHGHASDDLRLDHQCCVQALIGILSGETLLANETKLGYAAHNDSPLADQAAAISMV